MKKRLALYHLLLVIALCAGAQDVVVQARIDSSEIFIGQQVDVVLSVQSSVGASVVFPDVVGMELTPGIEVLRQTRDSVIPNKDNETRKQTLRRLTITSFDSSFYYIPPFVIQVDGKDYETNSLPLKVETVDIDTLHLDNFFGPKEIAPVPFKWSDWQGLVWKAIAFCLLLCLLIYVYIQVRTRRRFLPRLKLRALQPPHVWARKEIEKLKDETEMRGEAKEYYTRLTDILRIYLQRRYDFDAIQMTTGEIVQNLKLRLSGAGEDARRAGEELGALLDVADLAKFARLQTRLDEDAQNLLKALQFVDTTRQTEEELQQPQRPKPAPEVVRSSRTRLILCICMAVVALCALVLLFGICRSLYQLVIIG